MLTIVFQYTIETCKNEIYKILSCSVHNSSGTSGIQQKLKRIFKWKKCSCDPAE